MTRAMVIMVLVATMVLAAAAPGRADTIIGCEYDAVNELWAWDLGFEHQLASWLDFGATLKCYLDPEVPYSFRAGLIPAGVPYLQGYEIWVKATWGDLSLAISDWCNHYLAQSGVPAYYDTYGLTLRLEARL